MEHLGINVAEVDISCDSSDKNIPTERKGKVNYSIFFFWKVPISTVLNNNILRDLLPFKTDLISMRKICVCVPMCLCI